MGSSAYTGAACSTAAVAPRSMAMAARSPPPDALLDESWRALRVTAHPSGSAVGGCATQEEPVGGLRDVVEMTAALAVFVLDAGHRRRPEVSGCVAPWGAAE